MYDIIATKNTHSHECREDKNNEDAGKKLREYSKPPQEYGIDRIVRHIGEVAHAKCVVRWYGYTPDDSVYQTDNTS